jgi:hypothetical protein
MKFFTHKLSFSSISISNSFQSYFAPVDHRISQICSNRTSAPSNFNSALTSIMWNCHSQNSEKCDFVTIEMSWGKRKSFPHQTEILQLTFRILQKLSKLFSRIDKLWNVEIPETFFRRMWEWRWCWTCSWKGHVFFFHFGKPATDLTNWLLYLQFIGKSSLSANSTIRSRTVEIVNALEGWIDSKVDDRLIDKGVWVEIDEWEIRKWIGGKRLCLILRDQSALSPILAFSILPSTFLASSQSHCLLQWTFEFDHFSLQITFPHSYCLLLCSLHFCDQRLTFSMLTHFNRSISNRSSIPTLLSKIGHSFDPNVRQYVSHFSLPESDSVTFKSNVEAFLLFEMEWQSCSEWWMNFKFHSNSFKFNFRGDLSAWEIWSIWNAWSRADLNGAIVPPDRSQVSFPIIVCEGRESLERNEI